MDQTPSPSAIDEFRRFVEAGQHSGIAALLAPDVQFNSPVKFHPFTGREMVAGLLSVVGSIFEDFRYVGDQRGTSTSRTGDVAHAGTLEFRARIGKTQIHGIDLIELGDDGTIETFTVMIRPRSAADALGAAVYEGLVARGLV
ncbi:nuclear transport factor 2 family protein [Dermatophilaceae bacterium Sec6.4]|nr:nuclear transport factor 2 family protein [Actinomycetota bacterium]